jgi:hypothetical protein
MAETDSHNLGKQSGIGPPATTERPSVISSLKVQLKFYISVFKNDYLNVFPSHNQTFSKLNVGEIIRCQIPKLNFCGSSRQQTDE